MNPLAEQIEKLNESLILQLPEGVLDAFERSIIDLKESQLESNIIKPGERFPSFSLPNRLNEVVYSDDILKRGKMVLAFYRGSWCPYCNLELRMLQQNLQRIEKKGATLIAVSPQKTDNSKLITDHQLQFELLTDEDNRFAKKLGIVFSLQDFVLPSYEKVGINLREENGNTDHTLPIPAVFIVDTDGTIIYRFADANYINRIHIEELINAL